MPAYRYVIDYENAFTRSPASAEVATANVPLGSFIQLNFPAPPASATILNVYRTIGDGTAPNYIHRYVLPAATATLTDEATDSGFLTTGQTPILTGGAGILPTGAKYVVYHINRTWWLNLTNLNSRAMWSRDGAPEVFAATWITDFAPNDGDEITGAVGLPAGLFVGKTRSCHVFVGDPGEPPDIEPTGYKREISSKIGVGAPRSLVASGRYAYFIGDDSRPYRCDAISEPEDLGPAIEGILPATLANVCGFIDHDNKYRVCLAGLDFESWEVRYGRWAERLTLEAHRAALVAFGFSVPDLKQRLALAGDRAIRFAERGLPTSPADPFFVKIGPKGHGTFERDYREIFCHTRFKGNLDLIWETDTSAAAPAARTIALGTNASTATVPRALPPAVYGRRLFFGFRGASAPEILLEGVTDDRVALGALAPAP